MKPKSLSIAAAAAALACATLTGGTAVAQPAAAPASASATAALPTDCSHVLSPIKPKESVNIRTKPTAASTAIGVWPKGKSGAVCNDGNTYKGAKYTACGKTSDQWYYASYNSRKGWVLKTCVY
ncbi:hypothetical protein ABZ439_22030 [Streptomyces sp. NPDC005840]|jgi:uncharacterized protein YgiM (DUF1202 family)|uniref:SH3 domain-containing protein n=1 Tax=Streptomyces doudnae TaxID=3075536 RepID=A0ABD5EHL3_9ACTN|nr:MULTISPECIES: hypothetical protein [unclassified Streptomyces]MDT0434162.1 hypothetical protein [Streptomyces sp. DSM 41981]MYQ62869.1 hypothetical protein [Streptomyces sp. SID4950]SCD45861.1 hypothetical protein GA0115242_105667 [Streptomyces sp. SolWspMP-5a-2]